MSAMINYHIDICVRDERWNEELSESQARTIIDAAIEVMGEQTMTPFNEISLALLSDAQISALNAEFRGQNKPTNVLSFPALQIPGAQIMLGDIALAFETIQAEAQARNLAFADHICHLLIHGFYHLQNLDHQNEAQAEIMEALEIRALKHLGLAAPYDKDNTL